MNELNILNRIQQKVTIKTISTRFKEKLKINMVGLNMDGPTRDRVMKLMEEKEKLEREIANCHAILETNNTNMHEALVDREGFPRSDIDVYQVRHARHRIICLQNDHKAIMKRIEQGLTDVHSHLIGANGEGPSATLPELVSNMHVNGDMSNDVEMRNEHVEVFAVVGFVAEGSPADVAGLSTGDEIIQFGSVNRTNFADMAQVNDLVAHSVGQRIHVRVRRQQHILNLIVVPRPWQQPGLLGCQIRRVNA